MLYKTNRHAVWSKLCANRSEIRRDQTKTSIIVIMNLLVICTLWVGFLIDIAHCNPCETQFHDLNEDETSFMCPETCLKANSWVAGTDMYYTFSGICTAAVHAGILFEGGKGGNVSFVVMPKKRTLFQGTIRNRVRSRTWNGIERRGFKFTSPKWIPPHMDERSVVSDVVMVHNSYANQLNSLDDLWVTCLSEDTSLRPQIRIWRYNEDGYTRNTNTRNVTVSFPSDSNERIFECRGNYPVNDVWGTTMKNKTDTYMAEGFTFTKPQNSGLTINFVRSLFKDKVFKWFLPDDQRHVSEDSLPIHFKTLKSADEGVYLVGSTGEGKQLNESAFVSSSTYFQVIVRECPDEFYGRNCEHRCQTCYNGVCHPLIGSCICKPGYYGQQCDQTCKCDRFGSKCQFKCSEHLPRKVDGCRGLIFCLARPYGCSCYRGYKGQFCYEEDSQTSFSVKKETNCQTSFSVEKETNSQTSFSVEKETNSQTSFSVEKETNSQTSFSVEKETNSQTSFSVEKETNSQTSFSVEKETNSQTSFSVEKETNSQTSFSVENVTDSQMSFSVENETDSQLTVIILVTVIVVLLVVIIFLVTIMLMKYKCKSICRGNNSENENHSETASTTTSRTDQIGQAGSAGDVPVFYGDNRVQIGVPPEGAPSNIQNEESDEDRYTIGAESNPDERQDGFHRFIMGFPHNTKHIYTN